MSIASPTSKTPLDPPSVPRNFWPPLLVSLLVVSFLILVVLVQSFNEEIEHIVGFFDGAVANIVSLIFSFFALLTPYLWFCWSSRFSPTRQRVVLVLPLVLALVALATLRYEGVDGYMKPIFSWRWTQQHEAALTQEPAAAPGVTVVEGAGTKSPAVTPPLVDLRTETPDDFPQFLGPQRNNQVAGQLADDWNETAPVKRWVRDVGPGWSGFAVRNGFAVTLEQRGDDEWVTCYDVASGDLLWHHSAPGRHVEAVGGLGPRSTPTIDGGLVFVQGATGLVRCLDGATGQLVWQDDLLERYRMTQTDSEAAVKWGRSGSPLIAGNLVIVPAGGKGADVRTLIAYRKETGAVAWEAGNDQISYSSPVLAELGGVAQVVYVSEKKIAGYDLNGKQLWQQDWPSHSNGDANCSQGIPLGGGRVLASKGYGAGAQLLQVTKSGAEFSVEPLWESRRVMKTKFTNAVVIDGFAYDLSDGVLECVDLETGKQKWRGGRYGHGQLLGVGNKLLALGEDGDLMLVAADPQKFRQLSKIEALTGVTWNNLCLTGKRLLIRNGKQAACYELP